MNYVFDIDGTICFDYKNLSWQSMIFLNELKRNNHNIIFASARSYRDMLPVLKDRFSNHTLIASDGSVIVKNKEVVHVNAFEPSKLLQIFDLLKKYQAIYLAESIWDYHYNGDGSHSLMDFIDFFNQAENKDFDELDNLYKFVVFETSNDLAFKHELIELGLVVTQNKYNMVITPEIISKKTAIDVLGISEYTAFGNDDNDIDMLQHADHAVLVGNHEILVDLCDYQIDYNESYLKDLRNIYHKTLKK